MSSALANTFSLIEAEATSLNLDSIFNSTPILTVGSRNYDIIYTSVYYNAPNLYALEYNGNEKALARLRKILCLNPDTDETLAIFITKYKEPIHESNVKDYAIKIGSDYYRTYAEGEQETDEKTIHFHLLEGKIPEEYGFLDDDNQDATHPHQLIAQLSELTQSWS
jgi:hypothetical protein